MTRKNLYALIFTIICMLTFVIPSFASEPYASQQIRSYSISASSSDNYIDVEFDVTGAGRMEKIGCESIYIYRQSGSRWILDDSFTEDDSGMSDSNTVSHSNVISSSCSSGTKYKVVVTIFAEDSAGRDTRTQTKYVTGA